MPRTLTETATFDVPSGITVPTDGDTENAASIAAANTGLQALANRTQFLRGFVNGTIVGQVNAWQLAANSAVVNIGAITAVVLQGQVAGTTSTTALTIPSIAAATTYFIYAFINAGVLTFEADSANAPDAAGVFKNGDTSRRYICTVRTLTGSAFVAPFRKAGNRTLYRASTSAGTFSNALAAGVNTSNVWTVVDCFPWVPATAKLVEFRVLYQTTNATGPLEVRPFNDAAQQYDLQPGLISSAAAATHNEVLWMETAPALTNPFHPQIEYRSTATGTAPVITIDVLGYVE